MDTKGLWIRDLRSWRAIYTQNGYTPILTPVENLLKQISIETWLVSELNYFEFFRRFRIYLEEVKKSISPSYRI